MRVLLTGGAGFIGSHVADALLDRGYETLIVDDLSSGRRENLPEGAEFRPLDIRDGDGVQAVFREFRPDVVCHQAAQTSVAISTREPLRDADINVLGSIRLLDAARDVGARIVFASTGGAIYGEVPEDQAADEQWLPKPVSPYACSKYAFENYLHGYRAEHGVQATILRYANVYGPRQDPHGEAGVVAIFARRLKDGEPIRINARRALGDDGCVRDYISVRDVVRANLLAIDGKLEPMVMNVGTGIGTSTGTLARELHKTMSSRSEIGHGARRPGDLERSVLRPHPDLAQGLVPLAEGLRETAAWFAR